MRNILLYLWDLPALITSMGDRLCDLETLTERIMTTESDMKQALEDLSNAVSHNVQALHQEVLALEAQATRGPTVDSSTVRDAIARMREMTGRLEASSQSVLNPSGAVVQPPASTA